MGWFDRKKDVKAAGDKTRRIIPQDGGVVRRYVPDAPKVPVPKKQKKPKQALSEDTVVGYGLPVRVLLEDMAKSDERIKQMLETFDEFVGLGQTGMLKQAMRGLNKVEDITDIQKNLIKKYLEEVCDG